MIFFRKKAAAVVLTLPTLLAGCGNGYKSGEGSQVGTISRVGTHGALCPTIEGEMALMNIRGASSTGSTLHFSVIDQEVNKKLQKAMEDGNAVEVKWERRSSTGLCSIESDHLIIGVKEFNEGITRENPKSNVAATGNALPTQNSPKDKGKEIILKCVPGAKGTLSCEAM